MTSSDDSLIALERARARVQVQTVKARALSQFGERLVSRTALVCRLSGTLDDRATAYSAANRVGARGLGATA